jgi:hypothetical protein
MKSAVIGPTLVLTGALVLTGTAFAGGPQAHERSAPPASAPREAAVPRSAPPPPPPPPPPAPVRAAPTVAPRDSGNRPMPRTFSTPREGGVYERGGVRGADTGGRPPSIIRTEPASGSGSSPAPTVGGVSTVRGPEASDSPVFAAQRARTRSAGQPSTSSGSPARATPRGDRPRDNRSAIGTASPRTHPPYNGDHNHGHGGYSGYYGHHYYYPSYWWGYGAFGLGYFYYDPFWWGYPGYYGPVGGGAYGYGTGGAYGSQDPGYGTPDPGNGAPDPGNGAPDPGNGAPDPGYGSPDPAAYGVGQLKLKVSPPDAQVYVDGYFTGLVDDYDGFFQRLTIDSGPHRIEIRKPGFVTLSFDVRIPPDETVTYRGELQPQQP